MVSAMTAMKGFTKTCCNYGADGMMSKGGDCVQIPGAMKATAMAKVVASMLCGRSKGLVTIDNMDVAVSVCSQ